MQARTDREQYEAWLAARMAVTAPEPEHMPPVHQHKRRGEKVHRAPERKHDLTPRFEEAMIRTAVSNLRGLPSFSSDDIDRWLYKAAKAMEIHDPDAKKREELRAQVIEALKT